jgi:hypothetical protein
MSRETRMRILGLALAGVLAASSQAAAFADPQGNMSAAGRIMKVGQAIGAGSGPHAVPGHATRWVGGSHRPGWRPNQQFGGLGPSRWAGPVYWVWGPSGGAFDYPFADWRGPTGGWGNP